MGEGGVGGERMSNFPPTQHQSTRLCKVTQFWFYYTQLVTQLHAANYSSINYGVNND